MAMYGSQPFSGRIWPEGVKVSSAVSLPPAEEWVIDPTLPPLGNDPRYPNSDQIVIPRGRIVGVVADAANGSYYGRARVTLANGGSIKPLGYAETNMFRQWDERSQWMPVISKGDLIEVPYVASINAAHGVLAGGDKLAAFCGSATSTTVKPAQNIGKLVKWVEKKVYHTTASAAAAITLSSASYAGFTPVVVMAWNAGTVVATGSSVTPAWSGSAWVATFGQLVTDVLYTWGQDCTQICGQAVRIEPINSSHELQGWLKWVTDNFLAWEYPPMEMRVPTTDVSAESVSVSSNVGTLANTPIAPWKTIEVKLTGTVYNVQTGAAVTYTDDAMSVASNVPFVDYCLGEYYQIDPISGTITFSSNVSVTSVTVSYSYQTSYKDGRLWAPGVQQLTDGRLSGFPGVPSNLEVANLAGSLRAIIY